MSAAKTNALLPIENGTGRSNPRTVHSQKCEKRLPKPESEIKFGHAISCHRRREIAAVKRTICQDRRLWNSFNIPHAYFYGNCRTKVPIILPVRKTCSPQRVGMYFQDRPLHWV